MSLHFFPTALHPTPAQLAEARRIVSVETRTADDVARRPVARVAAWNVLRNARAQGRTSSGSDFPGAAA